MLKVVNIATGAVIAAFQVFSIIPVKDDSERPAWMSSGEWERNQLELRNTNEARTLHNARVRGCVRELVGTLNERAEGCGQPLVYTCVDTGGDDTLHVPQEPIVIQQP